MSKMSVLAERKKKKKIKKDKMGVAMPDIKIDRDGIPIINLEDDEPSLDTPFSYLQHMKDVANIGDLQFELLAKFYESPTSKYFIENKQTGKMEEVSKEEFKKEMEENAD